MHQSHLDDILTREMLWGHGDNRSISGRDTMPDSGTHNSKIVHKISTSQWTDLSNSFPLSNSGTYEYHGIFPLLSYVIWQKVSDFADVTNFPISWL